MESSMQHEQPPRDDRERYEAPAGQELGTVEELTASVCFPSTQECR